MKPARPVATGAADDLVERSVQMILPLTRASTPITLALGVMYGFIFVPAVGWWPYLAWYAALAVGFIGRQSYFEWLLRRRGTNARSLWQIAVVSAFSGWITTLAMPLFAPRLSAPELGVLTVIMVGTVTIAVSILAPLPKVYQTYVAAAFLNVFIAWARIAEPRDVAFIAVSLVLGGLMLARLGWLLAAQLRETVQISRANAELVLQLQQALSSEQEAQKARSRFLGAASHDLRQPVQALLFLVDLFANPAVRAEPGPLPGQIMRTAESIDAMFRHLVDYAQIDAGTLRAETQAVHLDRLVQAAVSGFAEKCQAKGLAFRLDAARPCAVTADAVLLERLLRNFLDNAYKYSLRGTIVLRWRIEGAQALIEVEDEGVGMDESDRLLAFNPFSRGRSAALAEAEGIGLGLAISKHMADAMGAQLRLRSEPGRGTCVSLYLPLASLPRAGAPGPAQRPSLQGRRVAVLEDDKLAREAFVLWLREAGAQPTAAATLAGALAALGDAAPDFVVADYRLAEGNGADAICALRERFGAVPALILTGERCTTAIETDVQVLQKPVSPERLLECIGGALGDIEAPQKA